MNVDAIVKSRVATVRPDDLLATSSQVMLWAEGRHLPVLDGDELVGVLSERDMLRARAEHAPEAQFVRDVMSTPAHTIAPEDPLAVAAGRMATEKLGCLPVVLGGKLVGR